MEYFLNIYYILVAQTVKQLSTMRETWVRSLGREDPLEKEMATHPSTIAWKIPWTEEPGRLQSMGSHKELDTTEWLHSLTHSLYSEQWAQYDIYHHIPETGTIISKLPMRKPRLTVLTETGKATRPGFEASWSTCKACTPNCHMILSPWHERWVRQQKEGKEVPPAKSGTQEW